MSYQGGGNQKKEKRSYTSRKVQNGKKNGALCLLCDWRKWRSSPLCSLGVCNTPVSLLKTEHVGEIAICCVLLGTTLFSVFSAMYAMLLRLVQTSNLKFFQGNISTCPTVLYRGFNHPSPYLSNGAVHLSHMMRNVLLRLKSNRRRWRRGGVWGGGRSVNHFITEPTLFRNELAGI